MVPSNTKETTALRRWHLIQKFFFEDSKSSLSPLDPVSNEEFRQRWISLRQSQPMNAPRKPPKSPRSGVPKLHGIKPTRDDTATRMGSLRGMEVLTREPSLTALDSPYRTALSILADLDWQYNDTGRQSPTVPVMAHMSSTIRYHPNQEAFIDEFTGRPIPKESTVSLKIPSSNYFGFTDLSEVHEHISRKPSVHDIYGKRKRRSFRLRNLRFSITQTVSRYVHSCLHPDVHM